MDTWKVGPGMAIAIVKDDKMVFAKGYGVRELGKDDKVDENTVFAIASNTKAFTTASLAILVDEKKIAWNDKVSKYLPDFQMYDPWVTSELTIRDLVSHRSRARYIQRRPALVRDNVSDRRNFAAGALSQACFELSHAIRLSESDVHRRRPRRRKGLRDEPWADFVKTRILTPLGMDRTTTSVRDLKDNYALPHNESGGKLRALPSVISMTRSAPFG